MKTIPLFPIGFKTYDRLKEIPGSILLASPGEPELFWKGHSGTNLFLVAAEDYHLDPKVVDLEGDETFVAGVLDTFFLIVASKVKWLATLPCRFYDIVLISEAGLFIRHEIGFCLVSWQGEITWDAGANLFENWHVIGDRICMKTLEGDLAFAKLPSEVDPEELRGVGMAK